MHTVHFLIIICTLNNNNNNPQFPNHHKSDFPIPTELEASGFSLIPSNIIKLSLGSFWWISDLLLFGDLMDHDTREESKYAENYVLNQGYGSSEIPKVSGSNVNYTQSRSVGKYNVVEDDDEQVEEDEDGEQEETNVGDGDINGSTLQNGNDDVDNDDEDGEDHNGRQSIVSVNMQRHPKKRKLKSLLLSYEFAPRVPPPTSTRKRSFGGRSTLRDWSEQETFVLLEAWGDRFLQCGRKSLRSEEWQEVADVVSQVSKIERTDSQCRNRLDTLKKKYKKEIANLKGNRDVVGSSKWVYFKKMDMLLSFNPLNNNTNLNSTNGLNDTRVVGSVKSDSLEGEHDNDDSDSDSDVLPLKKSEPGGSFKLLADSINKFSEIYEKIEKSKIQQMIELEKMRMDFLKDLELQKRQILDRAQAEITKVQQGDYEDNDVSAENVSG